MEMDKLDKRILELLQRDGRLSNTELAERVGLSPSPCWRQVKRLEESGMILDQVTLESHGNEVLGAFESLVDETPQIFECHAVSGVCNYLLKIVCHNMDDYEHLLSTRLLQLNGIRSDNTSFVLNHKKFTTAYPLVYC